MPGSADISGLNVQFGALDFGSEAGSVTADSQTELAREHTSTLAQTNMPAPAAVPTQQVQNSMFPKSGHVRYVYAITGNCCMHKRNYYSHAKGCRVNNAKLAFYFTPISVTSTSVVSVLGWALTNISSFCFLVWKVTTWAAYPQPYQMPTFLPPLWAYLVLLPPPHLVSPAQHHHRPLLCLRRPVEWRTVARELCLLILASRRAKMSHQVLPLLWR